MNKTCDVCGRDYQKIVVNPITKYCSECDHVYKVEPVDVEPILELIGKALDNNDGKDAQGKYQALRACADALEGDLIRLEKLAGVE